MNLIFKDFLYYLLCIFLEFLSCIFIDFSVCVFSCTFTAAHSLKFLSSVFLDLFSSIISQFSYSIFLLTIHFWNFHHSFWVFSLKASFCAFFLKRLLAPHLRTGSLWIFLHLVRAIFLFRMQHQLGYICLISGGVVKLKPGRREVPGSNPGRARSEFSVLLSETGINTG